MPAHQATNEVDLPWGHQSCCPLNASNGADAAGLTHRRNRWTIAMEALTSPTPILVALLTAIVFLCRAWPRGIHPKTLLTGQSEQFPQVTEAHDTQVVSKESDFPENWLNSSDIFQLERRAVFGKVSANKPAPSSKFRSLNTCGSTVMAVSFSPQPVHETWRLSVLRGGRLPYLPHPGQRW